MVRVIWIAALASLLGIVLYVPAIVPAERLVALLRAEEAAVRAAWGDERADRALARMLDMHGAARGRHVTEPVTAVAMTAANAALNAQIGQIGARLFANPYFKSIEALFSLATYRSSVLLEFAPLLAAFLFAVAADGLVVRVVRAREFIAHSAEIFGASAIAGIGFGALAVLCLFLPTPVDALLVVAALLAMLFCASRAIANYHYIR
jgi:hypothetical protein